MILKLARRRPFNRPVPRVVHPRRHFIRHQFAVTLKKFNRQHSNIIQLFHHAPRRHFRRLLQFRAQVRCRRNRQPQNSSAMMILDQWIERGFTGTAPRCQNRQLPLKRHKTFQQQRCRGEFSLHEFHVFSCSQHPLPFPVVPHTPRLQHRWQPNLLDCRIHVAGAVHFRKRSRRDP